MRSSYQRVFQRNLKSNPELLAGMLSLRLGGWKYRRLAEMYHVDKTTIRHWCQKYNIEPNIPPTRMGREQREDVKESIPDLVLVIREEKPQTKHKYQALFDEEDAINPGKSYAEYRAEAKQRKQEKTRELHF